ncbi:MAG: protein kinase [Patescibacteria group bacterium]
MPKTPDRIEHGSIPNGDTVIEENREKEKALPIVAGGRWEITECLHAKAKGELYEGRRSVPAEYNRETDPDFEVIIKTYPLDVPGKQKERLINEKDALINAGKNPWVVDVLDVVKLEDGREAIVMPKIKDLDLRFVKNRMGVERHNERFVADVAAQVCFGLASLHEQGLVHRDIKPENILVHIMSNDRTPYVMIGDLGLVGKLAESPLAKDVLFDFSAAGESVGALPYEGITPANTALGTIQYMSPEQLWAGQLSVQSDLFSLGVMMYELLVGERPLDAVVGRKNYNWDPILSDLYKKIKSPSEMLHEKETLLKKIVMQLLAVDPEDRKFVSIDGGERLDISDAMKLAAAIKYAMVKDGQASPQDYPYLHA